MKIRAGYLITQAASRYSHKTAIICAEGRFSFSACNTRVNRLANALLKLGLQKGERVAVLLPNCHRIIEARFALTKGGWVSVFLNTRHSVKEHIYILNDAEVSALIFGGEFLPLVEAIRDQIPTVQHFIGVEVNKEGILLYEELLATSSGTEPAIDVDEEDLDRLWYTSGTTGKPKGVMVTHRIWLNHLRNVFLNLETPITEDDVMLHVAPLTHASGNYVLPYFIEGARNVILKKFDPQHLLETVEQERVTTLFLVPTMITRLLAYPDRERYDLRSLRTIHYGTAPIPVAVLKQAISAFGNIFRQHYGLSEAIQPETLLLPADHVIEGTESEVRRLASAGRPALGVELKVVDAQGKEVAPGEVGEIIIRGDHIMKGYWKLPEVTAATIRDGWLYTNDLATVDEDGFIYLVDRKDDLIISGGFNIYPREVEEVLYTHPAVREAVVFGVPDQEWGECVAAVVVLKEGKQVTTEEIIAHCRANLAGYKKPRIVKFVDQLPQSASGKILRRELQRQWCEEQSERRGEA